MAADMVVKVGGSLYGIPDLGLRLQSWLAAQKPGRCLLVPGGGPVVDWLRELDRQERWSEATAHWLAIRALTLAAHVLAARLPGATVIRALADRFPAWDSGLAPILDPFDHLQGDPEFPVSWQATSDALAARVAAVAGMTEVVLLKSEEAPAGNDWQQAARLGHVDGCFASMLGQGIRARSVNLRAWPATASAPAPPGHEP